MKKSVFIAVLLLVVNYIMNGQDILVQKSNYYQMAHNIYPFILNSKVYAGMGYNAPPNPISFSDWYKYNEISDIWQPLYSNFSLLRFSLTICATNNKVFGELGYDVLDSKLKNDWRMYDTLSHTWVQRSSLSSTHRYNSFFFSINNSIYVYGGIDSAGNYLNEVWKYNTIIDSWTPRNNYPGYLISETFSWNNNSGNNWFNLNTDYQLSLLHISDIAINPINSNILYASVRENVGGNLMWRVKIPLDVGLREVANISNYNILLKDKNN